MKSNLRNIVKRTLNESYEINNTFRVIMENEGSSDIDKLDDVLKTLSVLSDEGKSEDEIESSLDEGVMDWLGSLFGPGEDKSSDQSKNTSLSPSNIGDKGKSAGLSQIREWVIRKGLAILGFEGNLADSIAASLADLDLRAVIGMFRGKDECLQYGDQVADAFLEGIATYLIGGARNNSMAANYLRQVGGEYLKASNVGEFIAEKLCNMDFRSALTRNA
jgi:hypothetical protein